MRIRHDDMATYRALLRDSITIENTNPQYLERLRGMWDAMLMTRAYDDICDIIILLHHMCTGAFTISNHDRAFIDNLISEPMIHETRDQHERWAMVSESIIRSFLGHSREYHGGNEYIRTQDLISSIRQASEPDPVPVLMDSLEDRIGIIKNTWKYMIHKREHHIEDSGALDVIFGYYPHDGIEQYAQLHAIQRIYDNVPMSEHHQLALIREAANAACIFNHHEYHDNDDEHRVSMLNNIVMNIRKGVPDSLSTHGRNAIISDIIYGGNLNSSIERMMEQSLHYTSSPSDKHHHIMSDHDYNDLMRTRKTGEYEQFLFAHILNDVFAAENGFSRYSIINVNLTKARFEEAYSRLHVFMLPGGSYDHVDSDYYASRGEVIDYIYTMYQQGISTEFIRESALMGTK